VYIGWRADFGEFLSNSRVRAGARSPVRILSDLNLGNFYKGHGIEQGHTEILNCIYFRNYELYVYIYLYMCIYIYICIYIHIFMYVFIYMYIYMYTVYMKQRLTLLSEILDYMCIHMYICVCIYIYVVYMYIYLSLSPSLYSYM